VGETQLEIDRRLIRRRIARLASDLRDIETERDERRKRRSAVPRVALVGYTNAGKSTLMNLLTGAGTRVENRLFSTLDPLVRRSERGGRPPFLVVDYGRLHPQASNHLVASFRSTLKEAAGADLLVHVIDSSSGSLQDQMRSTRDTLESLGLADDPRLLAFNKIDLAPANVLDRLEREYPEAVFLSALDPAQADRMDTGCGRRCAPPDQPGRRRRGRWLRSGRSDRGGTS